MRATLTRVLVLNAIAISFAQAHTFIDWHIGLYGASSSSMSILQALIVLSLGIPTIAWTLFLGLAGTGARNGLTGLFVLTLLWSFIGNGVAGVAACPTPCANAYPYQDATHYGNILFGGLAALFTRNAMTRHPQ